jgi:AcrR family transcriptional regulator
MANTRRRLIETSLELFARDGFDQITAEEIAATAGVSSSTLFRYFATKESLLFVGEYDYTSILCQAVARQPPERSDIQALIASMVELAPMMAAVQDRVRMYNQVVASSPLLLGRERAHHLDNVALLAEALAARHGRHADTATALLADVASTVLGRAHAQWLADAAGLALADVILDHFATITAALADGAP